MIIFKLSELNQCVIFGNYSIKWGDVPEGDVSVAGIPNGNVEHENMISIDV